VKGEADGAVPGPAVSAVDRRAQELFAKGNLSKNMSEPYYHLSPSISQSSPPLDDGVGDSGLAVWVRSEGTDRDPEKGLTPTSHGLSTA
jgi:hypothetical protein